MTDRRPGVLRRAFVGTWRVLDFSRRFILTVLFLIVVAFIIAAMLRPGVKVNDRSVLVIEPIGLIVEENSIASVDRAINQLMGADTPETRLRDVLEALGAAATDPRIERVLLRLDSLQGAGMASLREIGQAVDRVRAAGKQVVSYGDAYGQAGYYLAARADETYLHPYGMVLLQGLGRQRTYYADAFEKLGIEPRLFRVGEYKSGGETYVRSSASEEALEADRYWIGDLWRQYLEAVGNARSLSPVDIQAAIDNFPERLEAAAGDPGRLVLDAGLVTDLKSLDEVRELLVARGVRENGSFRQIRMADYLTALERERRADKAGTAPVAVIVAQGVILPGDQRAGSIGGVSTSALLRKAREDDDIKAVVLRIDSPGGGVFPSEQIRREVELLRRDGKPVVASMGDIAASGGYWIAMDTDHIVADPATITGSIGVYGTWFNASRTMDMLGLGTDGVGTTQMTNLFDPTQPYDPRVGRILQSTVDHSYQQFIGKVARARGTTPDAIDQVARGRVWSGVQAHERGLIDALGGLDDAIAQARSLAGLPDDARVAYVERELSRFERFMLNMSGSAMASIGRSTGAGAVFGWLPRGVRDDLATLSALAAGAGDPPVQVYAHCRCAAY